MTKYILRYGLYASLIVCPMMLLSVAAHKSAGLPNWASMAVGFAGMLLAFSFVFAGVKSYRDKQSGGVISFGRAFGLGLGIAVMASLCYTLVWIIVYKNFMPDYLEKYQQAEIAAMQQAGKPAAYIQQQSQEMNEMAASYRTWPGLILYTLMEIVPVGILVSLIAAAVLWKRKRTQPGFSPELR